MSFESMHHNNGFAQRLRRAFILSCFALAFVSVAISPVCGEELPASSIPYGKNLQAGGHLLINGARLYYETYGKGQALLLLHGNRGSIAGMKHQIEAFASKFKVIAVDCRGRGDSTLGDQPLTYELMARDAAALLDHLGIESAHVVGRSDGGIVALLMGIHSPEKVKKIVAFGANIAPDTAALYDSVIVEAKRDLKEAEEMLQKGDTSKDWRLLRELNHLLVHQPDISTNDLRRIRSPVLVMSCDRDVIREEHTLRIYRSIPKAHLCILPNETHWITTENPALFNAVVVKFLTDPFRGDEAR